MSTAAFKGRAGVILETLVNKKPKLLSHQSSEAFACVFYTDNSPHHLPRIKQTSHQECQSLKKIPSQTHPAVTNSHMAATAVADLGAKVSQCWEASDSCGLAGEWNCWLWNGVAVLCPRTSFSEKKRESVWDTKVNFKHVGSTAMWWTQNSDGYRRGSKSHSLP